jgi:hypothetical protein
LRTVLYGYRVDEVDMGDIRELRSEVYFRIKRKSNRMKRPPQALHYGPTIRAKPPHPDTSDCLSAIIGGRYRMGSIMPKINRQLMMECNLYIRENISQWFKPIPADYDFSFENWIARAPYPLYRKEELAKVKFAITDEKDAKHKRLKCFTKSESKADYKYNRLIYSRRDEFKVRFGPLIKALEDMIYQNEEFIKHVPVAERPAYIKNLIYEYGFSYDSTDFKNYESSFTPLHFYFIEREICLYLLQYNIHMMSMLDEFILTLSQVNICEFYDFIMYIVATRMSGEMNTSFGNGSTNFVLNKFLHHKKGLVPPKQGTEGDDGLKKHLPGAPDATDYGEMGFNIEIINHLNIEEASLCGMIYDVDECINIKNPMELVCEFFWLDKSYLCAKENKLKSLLRCKALSMMYQYPGCPLIYELSKKIVKLTNGLKIEIPTSIKNDIYKFDILNKAIDYYEVNKDKFHKETGIKTRLLVEKLYHIPVQDQLIIETQFLNMKNIFDFDDTHLMNFVPDLWKKFFDDYAITTDVTNNYNLFYPAKNFPFSLQQSNKVKNAQIIVLNQYGVKETVKVSDVFPEI